MARLRAPNVVPSRVIVVRATEYPRQAILVVGNGDDVDVVGHQAVPGDGDLIFLAVLPEQVQIQLTVAVVQENVLPAIASLCNVMPTTWNHDSGDSPH